MLHKYTCNRYDEQISRWHLEPSLCICQLRVRPPFGASPAIALATEVEAAFEHCNLQRVAEEMLDVGWVLYEQCLLNRG